MGITEKQPTFPIMTDLSLTFIGDGEGKVRYFFSNWMNSIVKYRKPASSSNPKHEMFEIGYKRDYTCTIDIVVVDRYNKKIFHIKVHEAWPIALGDQSLNWNDNDSLMNIPVTFTYYNWTQEVIDIDTASLAGDLAPSILGKVVKIGTAIQTLATIKKPKSIGDIINVTRNASNVVNGLKGLF